MSVNMVAPASLRICLCVILNHPFPQIIPSLRKIFEKRFSKVFFLIPYERSDDADIITVYRGSYCHAGYVTDAFSRLKDIECDHFLFIHDDVLLNPQINENNFYDIFKLSPQDGFIPHVKSESINSIGDWIWYFGHISRMLFPKSILFGTGVEPANMKKYLPNQELLYEKITRQNFTANSTVSIDIRENNNVTHKDMASRLLLYGFGKVITDDEHMKLIQKKCEAIIVSLANLYQNALGDDKFDIPDKTNIEVELPIPLLVSFMFSDFYILPKLSLKDFSHYIGVSSSANLFVEVMAPTLLCAVCDNLYTANDFNLDFSGFLQPVSLGEFRKKNFIAFHPFKLSGILSNPISKNMFFRYLDSFLNSDYAIGKDISGQCIDIYNCDIALCILSEGWYSVEDWGCWSKGNIGRLHFRAKPNSMIRIHLFSPVNEKYPKMEGRILVNGLKVVDIDSNIDSGKEIIIEFALPKSAQRESYTIDIVTLNPLNPYKLNLSSDRRTLGFGLKTIDVQALEEKIN